MATTAAGPGSAASAAACHHLDLPGNVHDATGDSKGLRPTVARRCRVHGLPRSNLDADKRDGSTAGPSLAQRQPRLLLGCAQASQPALTRRRQRCRSCALCRRRAQAADLGQLRVQEGAELARKLKGARLGPKLGRHRGIKAKLKAPGRVLQRALLRLFEVGRGGPEREQGNKSCRRAAVVVPGLTGDA